MHTSKEWKQHFESNLKIQRVDWDIAPTITEEEKKGILYSLKAWQKGETSDGRHLIRAASKYARNTGDPEYLEAVRLFIKEEQKHGANLGRYIDLIDEERLEFDWGDKLFRMVRYFKASMEMWTVTVIIVESAAQIFYQAIKDATNCALLKQICSDILIDEAFHIQFQQERLAKIYCAKSLATLYISISAYDLLFRMVVKAIWIGHGKAFEQGGVNKQRFQQLMRFKINKIFNAVRKEKLEYDIRRNKWSVVSGKW